MGIISNVKDRYKNRTITTVSLMTEQGNHYVSWNGNVYDFDIVRSVIRPKVKAMGKLVGKHILEQIRDDGSRNITVNPRVHMKILLEEPNPIMTGQMLQEKMATQLCINNNAFALISRDEMGVPNAIYPIVPVTAEASYPDGTLHLTFTMQNRKKYMFPYSDIIHLRRDFNENDVFGTPITQTLAPLLDVVHTTDQGIVNAIKNSSVIRWLLKFQTPIRPEDLKAQAKQFAENFLSTQEATGVAAVDSKADATQIDPKDYVPNASQMDKTTKRIYELFNTNSKIVDSSRTEEEWEAYFDSEIEPDLVQMGNEYTRKLFTRRERAYGNKIVFEASSWDGASLKTKLNLLQMVDRGALTPNEWRLAFNLAPVPGGDAPIRRLDTAPTQQKGGE